MSLNGELKRSELARIYHPNHEVYLEKRAAASWNTLRIWSKHFLKIDLYPTGAISAYRDMTGQRKTWADYLAGGNLAARPGTSNHGWGKAIDIPTWTMQQLVHRVGKNLSWDKIEAPSEPWHFNYVRYYKRPDPGLSVRYPVARFGSGGWGQKWYVKRIEKRLNSLGYKKVVADGNFGKATQEKIKHFQKLTGLRPDGVVGKQTWIKLFETNKKQLAKLQKANLAKKNKEDKPKPE